MVSIVVPVYKVEKYIRRCVESIIAQTFSDWELILVDDGSPDRSGEICDEYAEKDSRIKVYHKNNGGVSSARNYGIETSKGSWILFIDSDDWVEDNYLEAFFKIEHQNDTLVIQGRLDDKEDGSLIKKIDYNEKAYSKQELVAAIIENRLLYSGAPYCKLYKSTIIKDNGIKFPENYSFGEDTFFFFKYLYYINEIMLLSSAGYHYVHYQGDNLSQKKHEPQKLLDFLEDSLSALDLLDDSKHTLQAAYITSSVMLLRRALLNLYSLETDRGNRKKILSRIKSNVINMQAYNVPYSPKDVMLLWYIKYIPQSLLDFVLSKFLKRD